MLELRGTSPFLRDVRETVVDSLDSFNQADEGYAGNGNSSNPFMSIIREAAAHAHTLLLNIAWLPLSALANHFTTTPKQQKAADGEFKASHQSNCDWTGNNQTLTSALIASGQ